MKRIAMLVMGLTLSSSAFAWAITEKPHYERQDTGYVHGQNNDEDNQDNHRSDQDRNDGYYRSNQLFGWQIQKERDEHGQ